MSEFGCKLIENAKKDASWDDSLNAKLCKGDCIICPYVIPIVKLVMELGYFKDKARKISDNVVRCLICNFDYNLLDLVQSKRNKRIIFKCPECDTILMGYSNQKEVNESE